MALGGLPRDAHARPRSEHSRHSLNGATSSLFVIARRATALIGLVKSRVAMRNQTTALNSIVASLCGSGLLFLPRRIAKSGFKTELRHE